MSDGKSALDSDKEDKEDDIDYQSESENNYDENVGRTRTVMDMFARQDKELRFDEATGMKKKWLKHFHQRRKFVGSFFLLASILLFFSFGL